MLKVAAKWWTVGCVVSLLLTASVYGAALKAGDKAPAWKNLKGTDDKEHSLSDVKKAKAVVVAFTCNHCPVAVAYENRFIEFTKKLTRHEFSNALDDLEEGDWARIKAPFGNFTFEAQAEAERQAQNRLYQDVATAQDRYGNISWVASDPCIVTKHGLAYVQIEYEIRRL